MPSYTYHRPATATKTGYEPLGPPLKGSASSPEVGLSPISLDSTFKGLTVRSLETHPAELSPDTIHSRVELPAELHEIPRSMIAELDDTQIPRTH